MEGCSGGYGLPGHQLPYPTGPVSSLSKVDRCIRYLIAHQEYLQTLVYQATEVRHKHRTVFDGHLRDKTLRTFAALPQMFLYSTVFIQIGNMFG